MADVIACVLKSGGAYTPEYVDRLKQGVEKYTKIPFVCLSDVDVPCDRIPLRDNLPGWWSKIELFRMKNVFYLDLDTIITGEIFDMVERSYDFAMLEDFGKTKTLASGVMAWGEAEDIYLNFMLTPNEIMNNMRGDQDYIAATRPDAEKMQEIFPRRIHSYKIHGLRETTSILCFHGKPRPHEVNWCPS